MPNSFERTQNYILWVDNLLRVLATARKIACPSREEIRFLEEDIILLKESIANTVNVKEYKNSRKIIIELSSRFTSIWCKYYSEKDTNSTFLAFIALTQAPVYARKYLKNIDPRMKSEAAIKREALSVINPAAVSKEIIEEYRSRSGSSFDRLLLNSFDFSLAYREIGQHYDDRIRDISNS